MYKTIMLQRHKSFSDQMVFLKAVFHPRIKLYILSFNVCAFWSTPSSHFGNKALLILLSFLSYLLLLHMAKMFLQCLHIKHNSLVFNVDFFLLPFFKILIIFMIYIRVFSCLHVCIHLNAMPRGQKWVMGPVDLELQMVLCHTVW